MVWRCLAWALTMTAPEMQAELHVYCDWELSIIALSSFVCHNQFECS